ncbi:hypothetical protein M1P56_35955 (plasmid) [Streptomyces sp. HU2014]|uniref:hypothetical protein n=1 Tax=Streptomyces sp. HU2014 TaxID=2939414 RepID=UPI00200CC5DA|nr:hypothetical protein [Streptomyces sp. HU2014]UQI49799.1 hypothetical protein M1P56_35955 [Streptomyces sp. HU2014]
MKTVDGRQWATREDLIEHSGYGETTLKRLWRDRRANGHPGDRAFDGLMHWDMNAWDTWFAKYRERPRDLSGVDRSGDPDEQLPPAGQARVLGVDPARITQYGKTPPPGWPDPVRVEELPTRNREYRTRAQLWAWVDDPISGFGTKGGRPPGPDPKARARAAKVLDARVRLATEALAAMPDLKAGEVAAALAERHGQGVDTWKRIVTQARKQSQQQEAR